MWYLAAALLLFLALGLLVHNYIQDKRYLKGKTKDAISEELMEEIQVEREENKKLHDAFKKALADAKND